MVEPSCHRVRETFGSKPLLMCVLAWPRIGGVSLGFDVFDEYLLHILPPHPKGELFVWLQAFLAEGILDFVM